MSGRSGLPVGRLLAELGVIVVGVLVALLAESAWQERGERAEEREALERIRAEFSTDDADIRNDEILVAMLLEVQAEAAEVLAGTSGLSDREALAVLYGAVLVNQSLVEEGTWEDLVASGRTDLISDAELRRRLLTYFAHRERLTAAREALPGALRARVVAVLPVEYTDAVLNGCVRRPSDERQLQGPRPDAADALRRCGVTPEGGARGYLDRIRDLPDVDLALGELRYSIRSFGDQVRRTRASADELLEALDRELEDER